MGIIKITIVLDDTVAAQQTLLGQINTALASIAANVPPAGQQNIIVQRIS